MVIYILQSHLPTYANLALVGLSDPEIITKIYYSLTDFGRKRSVLQHACIY